jgi:hypothetical protein
MKTAKKIFVMVCVSLTIVATSFAQTPISPLADNDGNLTADVTTLTAGAPGTYWLLDKKIYVPAGKTINIQAGTVIKASVGSGLSSPALIVTRGAKIYALGTAENPIIFTSVEDNLDGAYSVNNRGKWGGVLIMGRAYNNLKDANEFGVADGEGTIEGLAIPDDRHHYGQDRYDPADTLGGQTLPPGVNFGDLKPDGDFNDDDNSGVMKYVSIRHGGAVIGDANEINGLTCGSVGRGTILEHIEVIANEDDGIEFFGGTVNIKYATIMFCNDDYIDWDMGYSGKGQFLYGLQLPASSDPVYPRQGDNGFEIDGDDDNLYLTDPLPPGVSLGNPVFYNVTLIGNGADEGIEAKERVEGTVINSVIANFNSGVHLNRETARAIDGYENWVADKFILKNNTFANNVMFLKVKGVMATTADSTDFAADGNLINNSVIDYTLVMNANTNQVTGTVNPVPAALGDVATDLLPPYDEFFTPVNYRGAFAPGVTPWTTGWTLSEDIPMDKGVIGCPSDISGNGITNTVDFLEVVGNWGPCTR